ncbi:alpha/beta hydrolase [Microbacterium terrisoli]|uniref:alpha/beta hydrolase n=1 Tax=Microbacterium terrisoli TaxID=3242192 RepID=UPI0028040D23|nr:alpha/beta fold hydrolase [Microbacterium protaetiae]
MNHSRRAAPRGPSRAARAGLGAAIAVLTTALVAVTGVWAAVSVRVARKVVTPQPRPMDTMIVGLDVAAQTITLGRSLDTELPGRYGLFTSGTASYIKLGSVLAADAAGVKRKLLTEIGADARLSAQAGFSGWYYDAPEQLHLPFTNELIGTSLGPSPAWLFAGAQDADTWVIQVHGRGAKRAECLRAVPVFHAAGLPVLVVSYRNDTEGPRTKDGLYGLGATEWRDVDAAIGFALRRGARRVLLMGWSMGGAIVLQASLNSAHREAIVGLVLDSPVIDWKSVLDFQARLLRLPEPVTDLAMNALQTNWAAPLTRTRAIPLDRLDIVARAAELRHPILILHSDDDGFVPSDASHRLAQARPDLVDLEVFQVARHTKLWNYDSERWTLAITDWLDRKAIAAHA